MKRIGILYHPKVEATRTKATELAAFLKRKGVTVWLCSAWEPQKITGLLPGTDLVITVGGDGTILRGIQAIGPAGTPITGINLGKLGFMTELDAGEAEDKLLNIINGDGWIDERTMLQAEVTTARKERSVFHALNDVVVARGNIARLVRVEAAVDGQPLTTYNADAVIVATATGSTGYALAAAGPVMYPQSRDFTMTPVAPHLSTAHSLVLPETAEVTLRMNTYHDATLSIDGHINQPLENGDTITIRRSPRTARFLRICPRESFFATLEEKLKGRQGESGRKD
ncbi:MAG: NAD(+)/NADH kinase [Dehalococcoidales bacterium]|nr:NAD(+)/NADH kinase [Dehalococcoidales bacterium]